MKYKIIALEYIHKKNLIRRPGNVSGNNKSMILIDVYTGVLSANIAILLLERW